jgi:transcription elongation factor Elf1
MLIENRFIQCPYCGEQIDIQIDATLAEQSYIEDCAVCCQPIELAITVYDDSISVTAKTGNE